MKLWLFYAKVGGGHQAAAQTLAKHCKKIDPRTHVTLVDLAEGSPAFLRYWFERGYDFLIHYAHWLYKLLYWLHRFRVVIAFEQQFTVWSAGRVLRKKFAEEQPDVIVATYFLVKPLLRAMAAAGKEIPLWVVVTDPFTPPPIWFSYPHLRYVVFSEEAKQVALTCGVPAGHIRVTSPVVQFETVKSKTVKNNIDQKQVLLIGGSSGLPWTRAIVKKLLAQGLRYRLVVVCGHNARLQRNMERLAEQAPNLVVYGFVGTVPELMRESDLIVTKAGPGVVFEALAADKPLVLTHYIWGQEKGNKDFVVGKGLGFYEPRLRKLPALIERCLFDVETVDRFKKARQKVVFCDGGAEVAGLILGSLLSF